MAKVAWGCYTVRSFLRAQHQGFCYNQSGHLHGEPTGFLLARRFPGRGTHTHTRTHTNTHWRSGASPPRSTNTAAERAPGPAAEPPRFATDTRFRHKKKYETNLWSAAPAGVVSLSLCSAVADKIRLRLTSPCYSAKPRSPPAAAHPPGARNNTKLWES